MAPAGVLLPEAGPEVWGCLVMCWGPHVYVTTKMYCPLFSIINLKLLLQFHSLIPWGWWWSGGGAGKRRWQREDF